MEWMYVVCIYQDHSLGLGVWGRNKINNRPESWACEFYYHKGGTQHIAKGCFMKEHL